MGQTDISTFYRQHRRQFWPLMAVLLGSVMLLSACDAPSSDIYAEPVMEEAVIMDEAVIADEPMIAPTPVVPASSSSRNARAGVITAGDIDDNLNFAALQRYVKTAQGELRLPRADLRNPVRLQLLGPDNRPAPGVRFTLRKAGSDRTFYSGHSGVDGMINVYPHALGLSSLGKFELRAVPEGQTQAFSMTLSPSNSRQQVKLPFAGEWEPDFLDLVFVVDTTGSMGDELAWLQRDLSRIVARAQKQAPGADIRYGLVVYRDHGDAYYVNNYGFTDSRSQMKRWLRDQAASGGGDYPEAAAAALQTGVALNWRRGKGERILFHVADAPPHSEEAFGYLEAVEEAAQKGIQIFGLGASGVGAESEYLMRQAAVQTSGRYLFLTDDSGVGYGHAEPTVSCYRVTDLSGLVTRVLASELSGQRVEANGADVIREVGSYRRGVCVN